VPLQSPSYGRSTKRRLRHAAEAAAGFEAGFHAHTAELQAVLVSGTWSSDEGKDLAGSKELTPGSYVMQPGKVFHDDKCKEGADCIIFVMQDAKATSSPRRCQEVRRDGCVAALANRRYRAPASPRQWLPGGAASGRRRIDRIVIAASGLARQSSPTAPTARDVQWNDRRSAR